MWATTVDHVQRQGHNANSILHRLVTASKRCREVGVLWEAIRDTGVATRVEDVHGGCKLFTNFAIWAMVGCGEHVIVDSLVVEMMQMRVHLRAASFAREALFLPSGVALQIGLALDHFDAFGVEASQSCIRGRQCSAALRAMAIYDPLRCTHSFNLTRPAKARSSAIRYC